MSTEEMRSFCQSIRPYGLRVQVRLKNGTELTFGKIEDVAADQFKIMTDDKVVKEFRYSWVARITNA